jgi:hypothetical protein
LAGPVSRYALRRYSRKIQGARKTDDGNKSTIHANFVI